MPLPLLLLIASACARHYRTQGVVLASDPVHHRVQVSHRAIPGYMEAMIMEFPVAPSTSMAALAPGTRIDFELNVRKHSAHISAIRPVSSGLDDVPLPQSANRLKTGDRVPDFALTAENGQTVRLSDFLGRPVALDFIYTRCPLPDVCPRLSANFAMLQRRFGERLVLLSITIDPQYDTPAVLADYAARWRARSGWRFLTGATSQIQNTAAPFGLVYWPEEGSITHNSEVALIGVDGRLRALLEGTGFTARQLVDLVEKLLAGPP